MFDTIQLDSVLRYPDFFLKTEIFFPVLVFAFRPHVNGVFGHQKTQVFENVPQSGVSFLCGIAESGGF